MLSAVLMKTADIYHIMYLTQLNGVFP